LLNVEVRISNPITVRVIEMFVALSRFTIANGLTDAVRAAFRRRPHLVDGASGFLSMEVMSPIGAPAEVWLVTRWQDEQSYRSWHRGHAYHEAHKGIPKGLKLVPGSAEVKLFEVFAD
jgi:heme-degrading monooxygenase HmoA